MNALSNDECFYNGLKFIRFILTKIWEILVSESNPGVMSIADLLF